MKALTVRPTIWHYRLYRWWLGKVEARERRLDLCRYMRCLLLWIPLTLLFVAVAYLGMAVSAPIWWPLTRRRPRQTVGRVASRVEEWGERPKARRFGRLLERVLLVGMVGLVAGGLGLAFYESWATALATIGVFLLVIALVLVFVAVVAAKADLLLLVWAWACAKKRRVCPLIEVEGA